MKFYASLLHPGDFRFYRENVLYFSRKLRLSMGVVAVDGRISLGRILHIFYGRLAMP
jgi:hypothetical protein